MTRFLTVLSTVLLVAAPGALRAQPVVSAVSDSSAILSVVQRLFDGMRAGDSSMVRSVFHPNARLITISSRGGKASVSIEPNADGFAKAVGTPHPVVWDERFRNARVSVDGALASVWVDYAFYAGPTFSHCGVDHFLLTRNDAGAWTVLELSDTRRTTGCEMWTGGTPSRTTPRNTPR